MPLAISDVEFLRSLVFQRSGNCISANQGYLLESRLTPVAETAGLPNVEALVAELRKPQGNRWHERVAEAMTINETSFFRDMQPFDALRDAIIPELLKRRSQRKLTIWSAASSSGQEAYSLAIILRENFPELLNWSIKIIATDYSDDMLMRTRSGEYSQFEVNRGLPAKMLLKYFVRRGNVWQADEQLRRMIEVRKLNLTSPMSVVPQCDIVFLRNVLIYFDVATKQAILGRVFKSLVSDGYLFLGGGETLINLSVPYMREEVGRTVCFRPIPHGIQTT